MRSQKDCWGSYKYREKINKLDESNNIPRQKTSKLIERPSLHGPWNPVRPKFFSKGASSMKFLEAPLLSQEFKAEEKEPSWQHEQPKLRAFRGLLLDKRRSVSAADGHHNINQPNSACTKSLSIIKSTG
jgi:hypothetical protein